MDRYINEDGKVGVLVSNGYGAGFSTWATAVEDVEFDHTTIQMLLDGKSSDTIAEYLDGKYPDEYWGGVDGLTVVWLDKGTEFRISEYDGAEGLEYRDSGVWSIA